MNKYNILDILGYWGPIILLVVTSFGLMMYNYNFLNYYVLFYIIGLLINSIIKTIIKQPRPQNQRHLYNFEDKGGAQHFGMPSGHAQTCLYSLLTNIYIIKMNIYIFFSIFITGITCWQRYIYRNHTIQQLLAGSIVGILVFYMTNNIYTIMQNKNKVYYE